MTKNQRRQTYLPSRKVIIYLWSLISFQLFCLLKLKGQRNKTSIIQCFPVLFTTHRFFFSTIAINLTQQHLLTKILEFQAECSITYSYFHVFKLLLFFSFFFYSYLFFSLVLIMFNFFLFTQGTLRVAKQRLRNNFTKKQSSKWRISRIQRHLSHKKLIKLLTGKLYSGHH